MPLFPVGISRNRDVSSLSAKLAAGTDDVRWSLSGELACAYVDAPHDGLKPMHHAAALDAIHRRICVLPVRPGMALHDETEIRALLDRHHHEFLDRLSRLDWTCEMELRITVPGQPRKRTAPKGKSKSLLSHIGWRRMGRCEVDSVKEQERLVVQRFVEYLHGTYRDWRRLPSAASQPIRLAFLVERDRVDAFRGRLEHADKISRKSRCVVVGPSPPYSFV